MKNASRAAALLALAWLVAPVAARADDLPALRRQAMAAYRAGDWKSFLDLSSRASALRPDHPGLLYNLACARALSGDAAGAVAALDELADRKVDLGAADDPDLEAARNAPGYERVAAKLAALRQPVGAASVAFELPEHDLMEGIALDPASGSVLIGSVHRRRILRRASSGAVTPFTTEPTLAVLGLAVDAKRHLLWAATSALPEMDGYQKDREGRTELVAFDLATGRVRQRRTPPEDGLRHAFNDVAVGASGEVFVSDSVGGVLYRLAPGAKSIEVLVPAGSLGSPNGLALTKDGKRLYVADYATTLYRVDLRAHKGAVARAERLVAPSRLVTIGIDGLVRYGDSLVGIQNGVTPHRVVRFRLVDDGARIDSAEILLMNHPRFDEPTLGVVAADTLWLLANSHWARFDAKQGTFPAESVTPTTILKLPL